MTIPNTIETFYKRFKPAANGCWEWISHLDRQKKYGIFNYQARHWRAHRLSYWFHKGEFNLDLYVCHTCDNPLCVNPDHLFLGTTQDNTSDRVKKDRSAKGEKNGDSRLTDDQVKSIKSSLESVTELSKKYKVSRTTVYKIKNRQSWQHIK
jgi:hypothetical protein